ncbi:aa3-type cytochrome c oxidase subunit IV [Sphingosinicella sp. LHD-64]|nr:aa3-type cytochrome c oxidase subunit IV [Sphingosinicella sp. LHD-64]MDQ8757924.1 aa3-type cytochrome c oxidase subunit IV [Sphingosinicella sp. LHD-64]
MAADAEAGKEFKAHANTYDFFIGLMKWGTILSAITAIIVVLIIAN